MKVTLLLADGTVLRTWHSYGAWASGAPGVRPGGPPCGRDNCNEHTPLTESNRE